MDSELSWVPYSKNPFSNLLFFKLSYPETNDVLYFSQSHNDFEFQDLCSCYLIELFL